MRGNRHKRYIRVWTPFCLLLLVFVVMAGCSADAKTTSMDPTAEITDSQKEELLHETNDRIYQIPERGDEQEEPAIMEAIYVGGKEVSVKEGRYKISGRQAGIITILDANGDEWFREVLGPSTNQVVVSLLDSDVIHADAGFEFVSVKAFEGEPENGYLTNGIWEVGKDIKPGTYRMTVTAGHGFVEILDEGHSPQVYEVTSDLRMLISEAQSITSEKERKEIMEKMEERDAAMFKKATLKKGQIIRITETGNVQFEKVDD